MDKMNRPYLPIVMNPDQARAELNTAARTAWDLPRQIADQLMEAKLTPLQAQAVLVRAWVRIQQLGTIRTPDHQPMEKE